MLYSILNLFVKYEQDEADMLSKVEDWWKSEENPHRNNPFSGRLFWFLNEFVYI
jgi:hypothetical protein